MVSFEQREEGGREGGTYDVVLGLLLALELAGAQVVPVLHDVGLAEDLALQFFLVALKLVAGRLYMRIYQHPQLVRVRGERLTTPRPYSGPSPTAPACLCSGYSSCPFCTSVPSRLAVGAGELTDGDMVRIGS